MVEQLKERCEAEGEEVLSSVACSSAEPSGTSRGGSTTSPRPSGRQGDPGESAFFLSAEDDLIRLFAGDRIYKILDRLGPVNEEGERPRGEDAHPHDRERPEEGRERTS